MRIAVYSSCGNGAESLYMSKYDFIPTRASLWDEISDMYPGHEFRVFYSYQGGATVDEDGEKLLLKAEKVEYTLLPLEYSVKEVADLIAEFEPDVAISFSTPSIPYDWGSVRDSLVADKLREKGIRVISNSTTFTEDSFEKHKINKKLALKGFNVPDDIYVNKALFDADLENTGVVRNGYRDYIRHRLEALTFPVILKADSGAGSVGLYVAADPDDAMDFIKNEKAGLDFLIEKRLTGANFGAEVYGCDGEYTFKGPIIFSSTKDGITDPFASVKYGPVESEAFKVSELKSEMLRLAREFDLNGSMEVDLMFVEGIWYIIEINPRFSLMSTLIAAIDNKNLFLNFIEPGLKGIKPVGVEASAATASAGSAESASAATSPVANKVVDFKTMVYDEDVIANVCRDFPSIRTAMRFRLATSSSSEVKYTEFAMGGFETDEELIAELRAIKAAYPMIVSDNVINNITNLSEYIGGFKL